MCFLQGICIYLKPEADHKTSCPYLAIKTFDEILVKLVGEDSMERFLICPKCIQEGKERFFKDVGPEFAILNSKLSYCDTMYLEQESGCVRHRIKDTPSSMLGETPSQSLASFLKIVALASLALSSSSLAICLT